MNAILDITKGAETQVADKNLNRTKQKYARIGQDYKLHAHSGTQAYTHMCTSTAQMCKLTCRHAHNTQIQTQTDTHKCFPDYLVPIPS